jgi:hypothetical protein
MANSVLSDGEINYLIYQYAAGVLSKHFSKEDFEQGVLAGNYNFLENKALLPDLMELYRFNLQFLCDEWLASNDKMSFFGKTPMHAAALFIIAEGKRGEALSGA